MGKFIALIILGCFCTLASFSVGKYHPDAKPARPVATVAQPVDLVVPAAYTAKDRNAMVKLLAKVEKESAERKRLATIAAIWNVTPENMNAYKGWWRWNGLKLR